ncbi:MAG: hypothetical protein ABSC05_31800 [Candidatus Solibacter sp.]|jgi:hypothetical protein
MTTALPEQCAKSSAHAPDGDSPSCLFVSTSLATWTTANSEQFARDFQINDTIYRRLDPEYYAWLRSRMVVAKKAATAGHLPPASFEVLRVRFNAVHEWAVEHFGEAPLLAAVRTFRSGDYEPPVSEDEGPHVSAPRVRKSATDDISPEAMALLESISEQALSLGWKRQRLYAAGGNRIFDPQRGLVCFLKPGDRIGDVTRHSIELIGPPPLEVRHRFYNPDVDQPWVRRIKTGQK